MNSLLIIFLLISYFLVGLNQNKYFVYYYVPMNFIYDILIFGVGEDSFFPYIRGIFFMGLNIYLFLKYYKSSATNRILYFVFLLLSILLIQTIFSSNPFKSIAETLKFINYIATFFISYQFFSKGFNIFILFQKYYIVIIALILNIIYANLTDFGFRGYNRASFYTGAVYANNWYGPTLIVMVFFLIIFSPLTVNILNTNLLKIRNSKIIRYLTAISLLLIIMGGRRSAVVILIVTIFVYFYYNRISIVFFKRILTLLVIIASTFPFYKNILFEQYENRLDFNQEGIEEENRYVETEYLWSEILSFNDPLVSLFGRDPFDTIGNYGGGLLGGRYLHVDINIIAFSSGIIGLLIYFIIYFSIFRLSINVFEKFNLYDKESFFLKLIFYATYFSSLILSFSGGFSAITYRTITFITLGSILGFLSNKSTVNEDSKIFK